MGPHYQHTWSLGQAARPTLLVILSQRANVPSRTTCSVPAPTTTLWLTWLAPRNLAKKHAVRCLTIESWSRKNQQLLPVMASRSSTFEQLQPMVTDDLSRLSVLHLGHLYSIQITTTETPVFILKQQFYKGFPLIVLTIGEAET